MWVITGDVCADSDAHHLQKQHRKNKLPVIGGMSMAEGIYLGAQVCSRQLPRQRHCFPLVD